MKVSTKPNKTGIAVVTNLTVEWNDPQAERALALQALVVKLQGTWRKGTIPSEASVKLSDYAPGTRHAADVNPFEAIKAMTPEERKAMIEKLKGLDEEQE